MLIISAIVLLIAGIAFKSQWMIILGVTLLIVGLSKKNETKEKPITNVVDNSNEIENEEIKRIKQVKANVIDKIKEAENEIARFENGRTYQLDNCNNAIYDIYSEVMVKRNISIQKSKLYDNYNYLKENFSNELDTYEFSKLDDIVNIARKNINNFDEQIRETRNVEKKYKNVEIKLNDMYKKEVKMQRLNQYMQNANLDSSIPDTVKRENEWDSIEQELYTLNEILKEKRMIDFENS